MDAAEFLAILKDPSVRAAVRDLLSDAPAPILYATMVEYAERQRVSARTVKRWVKDGLPSYKHGKTRRIPIEQADKWLLEGNAVVVSTRRTYRRRAT